MKFDFAIGNPPYQEDNENSVRKNPVYNYFMDAAYEVADIVELITPGRFLFNAGQTPKSWNEKMLNDEHLKVLHYEKDASVVFPNTDIKGGVVITVRNAKKKFKKISTFTPYDELNSIYQKITMKENVFMDSIISTRGLYRLKEQFFEDFPFAQSRLGDGTGNMIVSNIFEKIPEAFVEKIEKEDEKYLKILGRANNNRVFRYIKTQYVIENEYIPKYKVFFPEANASGRFGEVLSAPEIGNKNEGATDTFINIGVLDSEDEAKSLIKYIYTKFLRALLGIKKATQHTPRSVWDTIPLQDFTSNSDIDWKDTISGIDKQLYKKYSLSKEEIDFIENNVKEME